MCVHAHPDDESSKGAATMARYATEGVQVMVVTCTGGERGDILNPGLKDRPDLVADMPAVRRREMAQAQRVLGVDHRWLGFIDSGLPEGDPLPPLPDGCFGLEPVEQAAAPLVALMRSFRPQVVTTYDEGGGYPHPDHIMCHKITMAAYEASGDDSQYPDAGPAWQPSKLYYDITFTRERIETMHKAVIESGMESPYQEWLDKWDERTAGRRAPNLTTKIACGDYFEQRDQALMSHATQVDPDGMWFKVPLDLQRRVWPYEQFELARSRVETAIPEDDLFAGLRTTAVDS
jgi:mycothiol S-conjugate amidase